MICPRRKKAPFGTFVFLLAGEANKMSCGMQLFELCEFFACRMKYQLCEPPALEKLESYNRCFFPTEHITRMVQPVARHKIISRRIFQELRHFSINKVCLWRDM